MPTGPQDASSSEPAAPAAARPHRPARRLQLEISFRTMLLFGATVGLFALLIFLWPILVTVGVGLMLLGMMSPAVGWLERKGLGRGWAIAVVVLAITAAASTLLLVLLPRLASQASDIVEHLPEAQARLAARAESFRLTAPLADSIRRLRSAQVLSAAGTVIFVHSAAIAEVVAYGVSAFFLALYVLIDRNRMKGELFALVPRRFHVRASRVLLRLEEIVGGYLRGQVITSLLAGSFTFVVLTALQVPNALALAALAAFADVLPYVGAALACGPAALAALPRGAPVAVAVLLLLCGYQELESRFIVPRVYGRALRLPAAIVVLSLLIGGTLMGVLGALLALPLAATLRMLIEELRVELPGDDTDTSRVEANDLMNERTFERVSAGAPPQVAAVLATAIAATRILADDRNADPKSERELTSERDNLG
jgi:predicted PurR-regulated permease PerM